MGKRRRSKQKSARDWVEGLLAELHLDSADWIVESDLTKGALSGQRGVVVHVRSVRTGRSVKATGVASTKAEAREVRRTLAVRLLAEERGEGG